MIPCYFIYTRMCPSCLSEVHGIEQCGGGGQTRWDNQEGYDAFRAKVAEDVASAVPIAFGLMLVSVLAAAFPTAILVYKYVNRLPLYRQLPLESPKPLFIKLYPAALWLAPE